MCPSQARVTISLCETFYKQDFVSQTQALLLWIIPMQYDNCLEWKNKYKSCVYTKLHPLLSVSIFYIVFAA